MRKNSVHKYMKTPSNNALEKIDLCLSRHLLSFVPNTLGSNASAAPGSRVSTRSKSTSQRGVLRTKKMQLTKPVLIFGDYLPLDRRNF